MGEGNAGTFFLLYPFLMSPLVSRDDKLLSALPLTLLKMMGPFGQGLLLLLLMCLCYIQLRGSQWCRQLCHSYTHCCSVSSSGDTGGSGTLIRIRLRIKSVDNLASIFQSDFWMKNGGSFAQRMTLFALARLPDQLPKHFEFRIVDFSLVKKPKQTRVEMTSLAFALCVVKNK